PPIYTARARRANFVRVPPFIPRCQNIFLTLATPVSATAKGCGEPTPRKLNRERNYKMATIAKLTKHKDGSFRGVLILPSLAGAEIVFRPIAKPTATGPAYRVYTG